MEVVFLLSAELDLFQAYERHGDALHDKIDTALQFLRAHPEFAPTFRNRLRRKLVARSPFAIDDTIEGNRLIIHAVFDQRQDPQKILARLAKG
jgi:plasmid stabilization system protein ParE